jgi:hypothetical protein
MINVSAFWLLVAGCALLVKNHIASDQQPVARGRIPSEL